MGTSLQTTAANPTGQCRLCGGPLDRPRTGRPPEAHSDCSAVLWALDRLARAVQARKGRKMTRHELASLMKLAQWDVRMRRLIAEAAARGPRRGRPNDHNRARWR